jgi:hypothetical protein
MDPVTAAIVTAIVAGAIKVSETVVPDLYNGLKALLKRKFGEQSDVSKALEDLEAHPESAGRKATLEEEVKKAKANQDPELVAAAKELLEKVQASQDGARIVLTATGSNIAQAADHSNASVGNVPQKDKP